MVTGTLERMKELDQPNGMTVDVWLLDEEDSPEVNERCEQLGVLHFSRKGRPQFNTRCGAFKARTKHGNHNAWRHFHESEYDIVAQMDPDHAPRSDFLTRSVGYFTDPDVGFVVAPQVYGNLGDDFIAHGSAAQAYVFHGVIQRGGNGMGAPLLIGTNHLYRPDAFSQIDGYQDSIIEDHLTSMALYATVNPVTRNHWKGVYTPDILAVGEGPTSFADYFNQQKRWAYGIWEICLNHRSRWFPGMTRTQRRSFTLLQCFYPSVAAAWLLSNSITISYFVSGYSSGKLLQEWLVLWGASVASTVGLFLWLRRFNLAEHERRDSALTGMALLLMCIPVYVSASIAAVLRRPLGYAVTAKGHLSSPDRLATFHPHLWWAAGVGTLFAAGLAGFGSGYVAVRFWMTISCVVCLSPLAVHGFRTLRRKWQNALRKTMSGHEAVSGRLAQPVRAWKPLSEIPVQRPGSIHSGAAMWHVSEPLGPAHSAR